MNTTFRLLFYLKKPKNYQTGVVPIYLRITVNSQRAEMSTGRECDPDKWNTAAGRASGYKEEIKSLNIYLDTIQKKVYEAHRLLLDADQLITAESLKNKYIGKGEKPRSLIKIFEHHNNQIASLVGSEYASGTLQRYKISLKHTIDFLNWKYSIADIDVRLIDNEFITEFEFYLRSIRKCNNNSAIKYIKNFGKIIRICLSNDWLDKDPFRNYKAKVKAVERSYLNQDEIQSLGNKIFKSERLNIVKDIFLFSCYTGLAYADVKKLDSTQISTGIDGEKWIFTHRQKTDSRSNIPLLPQAQAILLKYKDNPKCLNSGALLPVPSNQKMNSYLKEIADFCEINKELTFHIARHTFATTITLANGVSIESVSKMLGHKSLLITQHYAKILDKSVSEDMRILSNKLTKNNNGMSKTG